MAKVKGSDNFEKMPQINGTDLIPSGGSQDQVLTKDSGSDYDYSWADASGGGGLGGSKQFYADMFNFPLSSDWAVNAFAPTAFDSNNSGLLVKRFDDNTEEGVGFSLIIPSTATSMTVRYKTRAETAPGGAATAVPKLYHRSLPDNNAVSSWSSNTLTNISLPTNEYWQYDEKTDTLANWGLTAGVQYQFEFTRDTGSGSDNLTGDLTLFVLEVEFS